jgi:ABC-type antimicrobial peptide transport system permease subunit
VPERLLATLSGFFGLVGMLLTATGLYGLLAYTVAQRTNEIGVRMAVGASAGTVASLVLNRCLRLVATGLLIGVPVAFWTTRIAASTVDNPPADSLVPTVAAIVGTIGVSLLAAWVPTRRATRVDPLVALRAE